MNEMIKKPSMNLLVGITDLENAKKMDCLMQKTGLPIQYHCRGEGTANSEIMDLLGLGGSDKAILLCIAPKAAIPKLMKALSSELDLYKPGRGIAFSISLSGLSNPILQQVDSHIKEDIIKQKEREVEQMSEKSSFCLVLAIVNQGYNEEVMEEARVHGARGGTIIHGRRAGMKEAMKFWGISLQSEKEIIAILVPKEKKMTIMQAIGKKYGIGSKAHGVVLSLPVDSVAGLEEMNI